MIGIGIDTGGTYTDAVIYDLNEKKILSSAKSLTTKSKLETGILNALSQLNTDHVQRADFIALSTTLATNACVESKGGRAKLMFIGADPNTVESQKDSYGLPSSDDIYFLEGDAAIPHKVPDWERFKADISEHFQDCDSVAIVQIHPRENNGAYEKKARDYLKEQLSIPCILGYDLFHDLNVLRRGASALLNARLLPVMEEFFASVHTALNKMGLNLPLVVVRSDGSLMSQEFACERPVETLLCGPAASIMGSMELSGSPNGVVVDMGGTTSDISLYKDHVPVTVQDGIQIGNWKTFVKGLYVDTFGLGGDSAVHYSSNGLYLDTRRVIPLCSLAAQYPEVVSQLEELNISEKKHSMFLHEFFVLIHMPSKQQNYTEFELSFCNALANGPLILKRAAQAVGKEIYTLDVSRLEQEGVMMRSGLTPTDIMHIRKDFGKFNADASFLAASFVARSVNITPEELCTRIYTLVKKKLYCNLGRILMKNQHPELFKALDEKAAEMLFDKCFEDAVKGEAPDFLKMELSASYPLVGIGAPIHLFLPDVAKLLGTTCIVPKYAPVANALGAVVGNVSASWITEIKPVYDAAGISCYQVFSQDGPLFFETPEEAEEAAISDALSGAKKEARKRGAASDLTTSFEKKDKTVLVGESQLFLGMQICARAVGRIFFM